MSISLPGWLLSSLSQSCNRCIHVRRNGWRTTHDLEIGLMMKAAGAWSAADLKLSPPRELGREVFLHDQSDRGPPARSDKDSLIKTSKALVAC